VKGGSCVNNCAVNVSKAFNRLDHYALLQLLVDRQLPRNVTGVLVKCKAISYSRRPELNTNYSISGVTIENIDNMKDLGVTFDNKLKFDKHINNKINTAYQILGIVKRNFIYLTPDSFVVLYTLSAHT